MKVINSLRDLKNLLETDFVDIYICKDKIYVKDFNTTEKKAIISNEISIKQIYAFCNEINRESGVNLSIPTYTEYFAVYFLDKNTKKLKGFRGTYGKNIEGEYINFRALSSPRPLHNFIKDPYLINFFSNSFRTNDSVIVSGPTGSGKTTLLVSFFDFINRYTPDKYKKELLQKYILTQKKLKIPLEKIEEYWQVSFDKEEKSFFMENLKRDNYYQMLEFIERENKRVVYTIENPIEYYHKSHNILFLQHDVGTHGNINNINKWLDSVYKSIKPVYRFFANLIDRIATSKIELVKGNNLKEFQNLADKALRTNPEYLFLGEIKNPLEFDIFLRAMSFGIPVYTTAHADSVFSMIQRIYDTSSFSSLEKLGLIARKIYGIVNTRIYFFRSLGQAISYFDILFLDDYSIRGKLYNFLKEGNLHKFAEELENHGIKRLEDNSIKLYYLNKKSSLLFAILNLLKENQLKLENPNIKNQFNEEIRFLIQRLNIKQLDLQKFKDYYLAGRYITEEDYLYLEDYILSLR